MPDEQPLGISSDQEGPVHPDTDNGDATAAAPSTFTGRLQLDTFRYTPDEQASPRRSARVSDKASSLSPLKRREQWTQAARHGSAASSEPSPGASPSSGGITKKKKKRKRHPTGYAPPSQYAHLPLLPDAVSPGLIVLFVGLNPGISTAEQGHAYAHPSNLFWKLLHSSGITPRLCRPDEDRAMPRLYRLGLTNIVGRPSRNGSELSRAEMDAGVQALHDKARRWRPRCVCIVGKSIWESVWRVRHGGRAVGKAFRYGWQDGEENMGAGGEDGWDGVPVFVASSTSGLAASLSPAEKQEIWNELGSWVKKQREEMEAEDPGKEA